MDLSETIIVELIVNAGNARSLAMEAIFAAKSAKFETAQQKMEEADEALILAHEIQTTLIQEESRGEKIEIKLIMIHAQDHLMNAMTVRDLAKEFIALYEKIEKERN